MNDTSRQLRYNLGVPCDRYNTMIADKDVLDYRLGSPEPYATTINDTNAEAAYLDESRSVSNELRAVIIEMVGVCQRIRTIEGF